MTTVTTSVSEHYVMSFFWQPLTVSLSEPVLLLLTIFLLVCFWALYKFLLLLTTSLTMSVSEHHAGSTICIWGDPRHSCHSSRSLHSRFASPVRSDEISYQAVASNGPGALPERHGLVWLMCVDTFAAFSCYVHLTSSGLDLRYKCRKCFYIKQSMTSKHIDKKRTKNIWCSFETHCMSSIAGFFIYIEMQWHTNSSH